jgi:NADPH-dependent curcumin reductase CurA
MAHNINTRVILRSRPVGLLNPSNFEVIKESVPKPVNKGDASSRVPSIDSVQVLIQSIYLSLDPAMRGWVEDAPSYMPPVKLGEVMRGLCVGVVLESLSPKYKPVCILCFEDAWDFCE